MNDLRCSLCNINEGDPACLTLIQTGYGAACGDCIMACMIIVQEQAMERCKKRMPPKLYELPKE